MGLLLIYLIGALSLSFLCSVLEAVLLSTPMSYISTLEMKNPRLASLMKRYKSNIDRPVSAILSLNTIAHTIGAAGVGAQAIELWGEAVFGIVSAVMTFLILVLSEIIPKTVGAFYWRDLCVEEHSCNPCAYHHYLSVGMAVGTHHPLADAKGCA